MAAKHETVSGKWVVTPLGRLSYPYLLEKNTKGEYPSDKYETTILIPKSADMTKMIQAVLDVAKEAFGGKITELSQLAHSPIRDGDQEDKGKDFKGHYFLKAKSSRQPGVVSADPKIPATEAEIYGGAKCHVRLKPYSYVQAGKPGVTWSLEAVQIIPGGERFGGSGSPSDGFTAFEDAAGDTPTINF